MEMYKLSRDAMVEIFDCAFVGVSSECAFGRPICGVVKELDCVRHPGLSRCHPCIRDREIRGGNLEVVGLMMAHLGFHRDKPCSLSAGLHIPSQTYFERCKRVDWVERG